MESPSFTEIPKHRTKNRKCTMPAKKENFDVCTSLRGFKFKRNGARPNSDMNVSGRSAWNTLSAWEKRSHNLKAIDKTV